MNTLNNQNIYENINPLLAPDIRGWNSDQPGLNHIIEKIRPTCIIEVGTWKGASAIHMGNLVKKYNLDCKIYCIDTWLGALEFWTTDAQTEERDLLLKNGYPQIYYQFLSNVKHSNLTDTIIPIPINSDIAYKVLRYYNIVANMIYIDASHEYDDVCRDLINYRTLLHRGGVICGDDWHQPQVQTAVKRIFPYSQIHIADNFWFVA